MSADLDTMTAADLRRRVISRDVSPVELTHRALAKAEATQGNLNAFFVLLPEAALAALPVRTLPPGLADFARRRVILDLPTDYY